MCIHILHAWSACTAHCKSREAISLQIALNYSFNIIMLHCVIKSIKPQRWQGYMHCQSCYQDRVIDQWLMNMDVSSGDVLKILVGFSKLKEIDWMHAQKGGKFY